MNSTRRFEKQDWTKFNTENKETFVIKRPEAEEFNRNNQKGNKDIKFPLSQIHEDIKIIPALCFLRVFCVLQLCEQVYMQHIFIQKPS